MATTSQKAVKIVDKILGKRSKSTVRKSLRPDAALSAVIGNRPVPSTEIDKKLWAYIKKNGLQDKKHKVFVNADKKLKPIFGGRSQVSLFEVSKLVSHHLKDEAKS
jgi:chromatin remodeling complex protein RSC6